MFRKFAFTLCLCASAAFGVPAQESASVNPVIDAIMSRRSVRVYESRPVEREKLSLIAECGINASNGMNRQAWQVRIVDSEEFIDGVTDVFRKANPEMASGKSFKNMFRNAPAVIFIASPSDKSGQVDCGLMGENMILAAQSLGLGTCCLGGPVAFLKSNADAKPYLDRLGLPDGYELLYAIAVGYPGESPDAKPRDASKIRFVE